jgi:predicted DNA-binding transcriptional regulator AlpA
MDTQSPAPLLHPVPAALKMLSIGRTSFYKLVDSGEIKLVKIGAKSLVADSNIREFITARLGKVA